MTVESVDSALEEVRPFLIADGGNVEVVDVSGGIVALRLQARFCPCYLSQPSLETQSFWQGKFKGILLSYSA